MAFEMNRLDIFDRRALDNMSSALNCGVMVSADGDAGAYINEKLAGYCGYSKDEFAKTFSRFIDCIHPDDQLYSQRQIKRALERGEGYEVIYRVVHKDGHTVWIRENGNRVTLSDGDTATISILVDISRDMAQRRNMENMSISDPLTGIMNREAFIERMRTLITDSATNSCKHALIMLDVDNFAEVNDVLGHDRGDQVLKEITASIRSTIRSADLFGRLGGDEFMLCLKDISIDNAFHRRMEQIRSLVSRPVDGTIISCSLGIAIYRQDGDDFEKLSNNANAALYEAKKRGRNRFVIYKKGMESGEFMPHMTPIDVRAEE